MLILLDMFVKINTVAFVLKLNFIGTTLQKVYYINYYYTLILYWRFLRLTYFK